MKQLKMITLLAITLLILTFSNSGYASHTSFSGREIHLILNKSEVRGLNSNLERKPESILSANEVILNEALTTSRQVIEGDRIILNLFDNAEYTAIVDRIKININNTYTVRARLEGYEMSYLLISTTGNKTLGLISIPELGKEYEIIYQDQGQNHLLLAIDPSKKDERENLSAIAPTEQSERGNADYLEAQKRYATIQQKGGDRPDNIAEIDIMVIYTPAAKKWADLYASSIENCVAAAIERGQLAFDSSEIKINFNLVFSAGVNYIESGSANTDLSRLNGTNDGYMDEVHEWRRISGADEMTLLATLDDAGGIGYLLKTPTGNYSTGMNVVRIQQANNSYTLVHEVGHNMGLGHHAEQNYQAGPGMSSYSSGWRWTGDDEKHYCSVMTYEAGAYFSDGIDHQRVAHFSSPIISHQGALTGHAEKADNRRTLLETKHVVAAYSLDPEEAATIEGHVYLKDSDIPVANASVRFLNINYPLYTNSDGYYRVFAVPEEVVDIQVSKPDHHTTTVEGVTLEQGKITTLDISIEKFHRMNVSGLVCSSDSPDIGLVGAKVQLTGIENFDVDADENGMFEIKDVRSDFTYELKIFADGYELYNDFVSVPHYSSNIELDKIILTELAYPAYSVVASQTEESTAEITWAIPHLNYDTFKRDSGIITEYMGIPSGTENTIFGTSFPDNTLVHEVSWYLGTPVGTHQSVNIFIFGLDSQAKPDTNNLLFKEIGVENIDNKWNRYRLPYVIEAPNGFMLGLSCSGHLSLAMDGGVGPDYPFIDGTQFISINYLTNNWLDISTSGIRKNLFLRAEGYDLSSPERMLTYLNSPHELFGARELKRFTVFRFSLGEERNQEKWVELGKSSELSYTDSEWDTLLNGDYRYAVKAEYTNGVHSLAALSNTVTYNESIGRIGQVNIAFSPDEYLELAWEWFPQDNTEREFKGFTITRNGNILAEGIETQHYHDYNIPAGILKYTVAAKYTNGHSNQGVQSYFNTTGPSNLKAEVHADGAVELTWESPLIEDVENSGYLGYEIFRDGELRNETPVEENHYLDRGAKIGEDCAYYVRIAYSNDNFSEPSNEVVVTVTNVDNTLATPLYTSLNTNYPNPFNPETTISFSLKEESDTSIKIYDIKGRAVTTLIDRKLPVGTYKIVWNGSNKEGTAVSSGIYFYKMETPSYSSIKKMILLK